jgi:hypothetical protein
MTPLVTKGSFVGGRVGKERYLFFPVIFLCAEVVDYYVSGDGN